MRRGLLSLILALVALAAPPANAKSPASGKLVLGCDQLAHKSFGALGVLGAAAEQSIDGHRYCAVSGRIAPQTGIRLLLPLNDWRDQYLQQGCATYCGTSTLDPAAPLAGYQCAPVTDGTLAMAKDDSGHGSADPNDASFGKNPALRKAFGRTSEHSTALLAKAVLRAFYGHGPRYSYYDGCSTGGRQALVEAQNYPTDFNGILAGSPIINLAGISLEQAWLVRSNTDAHGKQILPAEKLPALHAAVVKQCGDATGTVPDPRQCAFDPASLRCPAGSTGATDNCLTSQQIESVRKFYRGASTASGLQLFNGGMPYGSELAWKSWMVMPRADTTAPADSQAAQVALSGFRYLYYPHNPPASFTLADVHFTVAEYLRGDRYAQRIYNATNPDLRAFAAHGGKLILYHGQADEAVTPKSTEDYYAWVERVAGGFAASQQFSRLYLVPGGYHCLFGPDITAPARMNYVELLQPLTDWVQHGTAPGEIPAPEGPGPVNGTGDVIPHQLVPVDALHPAPSAPGSLNAGNRFVGAAFDYLPR
jgi:feruloyl esterase